MGAGDQHNRPGIAPQDDQGFGPHDQNQPREHIQQNPQGADQHFDPSVAASFDSPQPSQQNGPGTRVPGQWREAAHDRPARTYNPQGGVNDQFDNPSLLDGLVDRFDDRGASTENTASRRRPGQWRE